jgi:UrcA family protein
MNTLTASTGLRGLIAAAIVTAVASSFAAGSAAAAGIDVTSPTVKFADLDISSPQGALQLYIRIHKAAATACSFYPFKSERGLDLCVSNSTAKAVTKVNQPALFAVYNAKNKTHMPQLLAGPQPR